MAQADQKGSARGAQMEPHYAVSETQQTRLQTLGLAMRGLAAIAHNGDMVEAENGAGVTRHQLFALFEVLGDQLETISESFAFVGTVN